MSAKILYSSRNLWALITQNLTNYMPQLSLIANYKNILDLIMKQLSLPYWYLTSTYSSQHINHILPEYAYSVILHSNTPNKNISWTVKYLCKIPAAYVDYSLWLNVYILLCLRYSRCYSNYCQRLTCFVYISILIFYSKQAGPTTWFIF